MHVHPIELFDLKPYAKPLVIKATEGAKIKRRSIKNNELQTKLFSEKSPEMEMQKATKLAYNAWLKRSLREYPKLPEKIKRLQELAAGGKVERQERADRTRTQKRPRPTKLLSDDERYLAEVIRASVPEAFHKKPIGLLTSGRFHQQVRTLITTESDLQPLLRRFAEGRTVEFCSSPTEKAILRQEYSREHAALMARQLTEHKAVFDIALTQLRTYQPEAHELLQLRFMLRHSVVKVMMELEMESESTYADHLRDSLKWLGCFVSEAREQVQAKEKTPQF